MTPQALVGLAASLAPDLAWGAAEVGEEATLFPEERSAVSNARPARLAEFTAGRLAARRAMEAARLPLDAVGVATDRTPIWPSGLRGSISHSSRLALAAVSLGAVSPGIDVEPTGRLAPEEIDTIVGPEDVGDPLGVFSAKEAVYKAIYPLTRVVFGFHGLRIDLATGHAQLVDQPDTAAISPHFRSIEFRFQQAVLGGFILSVCKVPVKAAF